MGADIRYRASFPLSIVTTSVDKTLRIIDYQTGEVSPRSEEERVC
jgi:hypothetical protein